MRRWILALAACAPAVTPSPSPRGPDDAPPRETTSAPAPARPALATRPEFLECERPDGPARPLSEREAYHWMAPDFRRSTDSMHDVARSIDEAEARLASAPADGAASRHHAELRVMVAMDHLQMSDHHGAMACVGEFAEDRPRDLGQQWYLAKHHLRAALGHTRTAWSRPDGLDAKWLALLQCARTLTAARLGELDEALMASATLPDQPCADTALVWLGDALDRDRRHAEARSMFTRVLARDHDSHFNATCPVAPPTPRTDVQLRDRPDFFADLCKWSWYVRYRLVWLDLRAGALSAPDAILALEAIAAHHRPDEYAVAAGTLRAAIQRDIAALGAAP